MSVDTMSANTSARKPCTHVLPRISSAANIHHAAAAAPAAATPSAASSSCTGSAERVYSPTVHILRTHPWRERARE